MQAQTTFTNRAVLGLTRNLVSVPEHEFQKKLCFLRLAVDVCLKVGETERKSLPQRG